MIELLIALVLIWVIFANIQDLKSREIANWISFSLIIFVLVIRLFYSLFSNNYWWFLFGLIGLGIFFLLGHLFYHARLFAGGDAKLFIAFGVIVPLSLSWLENIVYAMIFIMALLFLGGIYSLVYSGVLALKNKKSFKIELEKQFNKNKGLLFIGLGIAFILAFFIILLARGNSLLFLVFSFLILLMPLLYIYTKAIEQCCMVKWVSVDKITIGDWLVKDLEVKDRKIASNWEGISESDLEFLQKNYKNKVLVKYGIPFSPSFLFAFIVLIIVNYVGIYKILGLMY
ncbi:MAG: prepilin peptidase [Candidatus Pacearchaeota archaeon]|jgi:Flp pilus assembly protein protease CpaA